MRSLTAQQVRRFLDERPDTQLIDVREPWEFDIARIDGALLIPLRTLPDRSPEIDPERPVIVYCHHGIRSQHACAFLELAGHTDVYNMLGGIQAWTASVDPDIPDY